VGIQQDAARELEELLAGLQHTLAGQSSEQVSAAEQLNRHATEIAANSALLVAHQRINEGLRSRIEALEGVLVVDPPPPPQATPDPSRDGFVLAFVADLSGDLDEMGVGVQRGSLDGITLADGILWTSLQPDHPPRGTSMRSEISLAGPGRVIGHGEKIRMVREIALEELPNRPFFRASMTINQSHSTSNANQHSPPTGASIESDGVITFEREDERGRDIPIGELTPPIGPWLYEEHELHAFEDFRGFAAYRLHEIGGAYAEEAVWQGPTQNVRTADTDGNYDDPTEVEFYMKGGAYATGRSVEDGAGITYATRRVELWIKR
jgi:hypothetical protein